MYRYFELKDILQHLSIYSNPNELKEVDITAIKPFIEKPSPSKLVELLTNKNISKEVKQSVLVSLNSSLNYTSIKPFLKDKSALYYLLNGIPIKPIYNYEQIKTITEYVINKSTNTNVYSNAQMLDVKQVLENEGMEFQLSTNGFNDIKWNDTCANADGLLFLPSGEVIIVYLRYGSGTGGAQNDRYRNMFDTVIKNKDKRFLFVVDGPEAVLQYDLSSSILNKGDYPNAIWSTAKLLPYINFEDLKFS